MFPILKKYFFGVPPAPIMGESDKNLEGLAFSHSGSPIIGGRGDSYGLTVQKLPPDSWAAKSAPVIFLTLPSSNSMRTLSALGTW